MTDETTAGAPTAETESETHCPSCQSRDIRFGRGSVFKIPFVPETPLLQYARSYHPRQFVCLDCGHLGFVLKPSDLKRLQADMRRKDASGE